jgi:hypothetical protein
LIQTNHSVLKQNQKANEWFILLKLNGDKKETNEFRLDRNNFKSLKQVSSATSTSGDAYLHEFHINLPDVGKVRVHYYLNLILNYKCKKLLKVKKLIWISCHNLNGNDEFFIQEIRLKIAYRNELLM